jgi:hypothetical protein
MIMTRADIRRALLAVKARRLRAPGHRRYRSHGSPGTCIVGALMTSAELERIAARPGGLSMTVAGLIGEGLLPDRLRPHASLLTDLQQNYDDGPFKKQTFLDVVLPNLLDRNGYKGEDKP